MSTSNEFVQRAINDLASIRKAIESAGGDENTKQDKFVTGTNLLIQILAMGMATSLLVFELLTGNLGSRILDFTAYSDELGRSNIFSIGLVLLVLLLGLYILVFMASRKTRKDFNKFIARNFAYLKNLSFVSDLLVKFFILALLIHVHQAKWIAPLLFVFIGDYLMQGRFFTISLKLSLALGLLYFVFAGIQAYMESSMLNWPLAGFILVCGISIAENLRLGRKQSKKETV